MESETQMNWNRSAERMRTFLQERRLALRHFVGKQRFTSATLTLGSFLRNVHETQPTASAHSFLGAIKSVSGQTRIAPLALAFGLSLHGPFLAGLAHVPVPSFRIRSQPKSK